MGQITRTNFGLVKSRTLTDSEIKNLPTSPITIIDAIPGAIIAPIYCWARLSWVANYTGIDAAAQFGIAWSFDFFSPVSVLFESTGFVSQLLAAGESRSAFLGVAANINPAPVFQYGSIVQEAEVVNVPIIAFIDNGGSGNLGGGNAGNSLKMSVFYNVFEV